MLAAGQRQKSGQAPYQTNTRYANSFDNFPPRPVRFSET